MLDRLSDYYFWFSQPPTFLDNADKYFLYLFLGLLVLAIISLILAKFVKNPIDKKLFGRFWNLLLSTSLAGLVWYGVRYENTPIFGRRYWAGLTLAIGLIWLGFIVKYLIFNYRGQKSEFSREQIKNKYLPKAK